MAGTEFTVTGTNNLRDLAKQMPTIREFNKARDELNENLNDITALQQDTPGLQAKFDKVGSVLREVAVDAKASLGASLENPLTGFEVDGDPETDATVDVRTGDFAP